MKKVLITRLFGLLALLVSQQVSAYEFESGGIYYSIYGDEARVTWGDTKYQGDVVIPSQVKYRGKTYSVTKIGYNAFSDCIGLTSITIPNSINSIRENAFVHCDNLIAVHISDLEAWLNIYIEEGSFSDGGNYYASSPLFYAGHLFLNGTEIKDLVIPNGVTYIGGFDFLGCVGLTSVTIPNSVTEIGMWAFMYCSGLTSVNIGNSVTSIGNSAFFGCRGLTSVNIGNSVTSIGSSAFASCSGLTSITIPNSVTSIGSSAFASCSDLTSITVDSGNPKYDSRNNCNAIIETSNSTLIAGCKNTIIPNSVTSIGSYAFASCSGLTSITIPNSVTSIGSSAFKYCSDLTSITVDSGNPKYDSRNNCNAIIETSNSTLIAGCKNTIIPNSVTSIGWAAFLWCSGLTTIVSKIEKPFEIDSYTFDSDTYNVAELIVPKGTKALYQATEGWNKFTKITEASGEEEVNEFSVDGIYYKVNTDNRNEVTVVKGDEKLSGDVVIPDQVIYKGKTYNVTSIKSHAFILCNHLASISIPNGVTYINSQTFLSCDSLTSVTIPSSVKRIYSEAFHFCWALTSINIDDIEAWCKIWIEFWNSIQGHLVLNGRVLKELVIPNSVTSINDYAFYCRDLTSVAIPNSVTSIGRSAFFQYEGLTTIVSEIEKPFAINNNTFSDNTYTNAELIVPKGTKALYQTTEGWNNFTKIIEAADKDEVLFTIDGVTCQGSKSGKTVVVKSVDASRTWMEIPASISYDGTTYQVTGIADDTFKGSSMGALIWDVEAALPNNAFSNASIGSNFLLYVKSASYAPSMVKNVVVDGTAQTIALSDDGGQFYCPQTFIARSISYTHNYTMETGGSKGWEALTLPFFVQKISHSTHGEIVPFALYSSSSSQKPFWLGKISGNEFKRTSAIEANEPYIIAMPNNKRYRNEYNLAGEVTFSAENAAVPKTPTFEGQFIPAYAPVAKSSSVKALNNASYSGGYDPGSRFISNLRDVHPFEAYMTGGSSRGIVEINFDDGTTDMPDILFSTDESQEITIHTLSGQQVTRTIQRDFDAVWLQLPKGVYIVNGKKMIK